MRVVHGGGRWWRVLALAGSVVVSACSGADMGAYGGSGSYGATPGGVKDLNAAREAVEQGLVPSPQSLVVEAMFAEHDLPLAGPACDAPLCLNTALGFAPDHAGQPRGWLQVGLSSNVNPQTYQRPAVSLVACVDVSGSMGWGGSASSPGELSRRVLQALIPQLGPQDELALVTYGTDVEDVLGFTRGDAHAQLLSAVDGLATNGSTNMEAGLARAFELARGRQTVERRVLLFTDALPNVGATDASSFQGMAAAAAAQGTSLTVLAMGLGLGAEHMVAMSHLRGGNAFSFTDEADVPDFMEKQWPLFLSPVAHDLSLKVGPRSGFRVGRGYGFPSGPDDTDGMVLEVKSVFLSRNRGALLVQLDPDAQATVEQLGVVGTLSFVPAQGGDRVTRTLDTMFNGPAPDARGHTYEQRGVARTTALALLVSGMRAAAETYAAGDNTGAASAMDAVAQRFEADATALGDADLAVEVAFGRAVADLMAANARQLP